MTQVDTQRESHEKGSRRGSPYGLAALLAVTAALLLASCSNGDPGLEPETKLAEPATTVGEVVSTHEALLHEYAAARNAGDIDAILGLFTSRAEQKRHPLEPWDGKKRRSIDPLGYLNGPDEIALIEGQVPAVQGSGSGVEFFDIVVNEGAVTAPDVEFRWRFLFGADGADSGGEAGCIGGERGSAFIQDGEFAVFDWGFNDPTACES